MTRYVMKEVTNVNSTANTQSLTVENRCHAIIEVNGVYVRCILNEYHDGDHQTETINFKISWKFIFPRV